jgi:hypothetical protein
VRHALLALVLAVGPAALGRPRSPAECQKDSKDFMGICLKQCDTLLKKNGQRAVDACQKTCRSQAPLMEKKCEDGKL